MLEFWHAAFSRAFWESFTLFYDRPALLLVGLLGMLVTAVLVLTSRGREAFTEHVKANVLVVIGGGIATWLLVFPYYIMWAPFAMASDVQSQLKLYQQRERAAITRMQSADLQLRELVAARPSRSPVAARPELKIFVTGINSNFPDAPEGRAFFVTANFTSPSPFTLRVKCDVPLLHGISTLMRTQTGNFVAQTSQDILKGEYQLTVSAPRLTPSTAVVMSLFGAKRLGDCRVASSQ